MAKEKDFLEIKAWYSGTWRDDDVTDNIIRQIAAQTLAEKGKKVKLRILPEGLRVTKSNFFQGTIMSDFIPLGNIYFMTVNQHHPHILLAIIKDVTRKYMILAFKCKNPVDSGNMIHYWKGFKERLSDKAENFELKRKDNGNWTLKDRSNSNAHRHLLEIYGKPNGEVKTTPIFLPQDDVIERDEDHTHGRDQHNIAIQTARLGHDVDAMSEASDVTLRDELETLSHELREIKYMLEKSTGISAEEHLKHHRQRSQPNSARDGYSHHHHHHHNNNNAAHVNHNTDVVVLREKKPEGYTPNGDQQQQGGVVRVSVPDYRSFGVQTAPKSKSKKTSAAYPGFIRVNGPKDDGDDDKRMDTPRPASVVVTSQPPPPASTVVMTSEPVKTSYVVTPEPVKTSYVVTPRPENGKPAKPMVNAHTTTTTTTTVRKTSPRTPRRQEKEDVPEYAVVRRYVVPPSSREDGPERLVATRSSTLPRYASDNPSTPRSQNGGNPPMEPYAPHVRTTYQTVMEGRPHDGYYVKFDPRLLPKDRRPRSRKVPVQGYRVPSTVVRPIEDTYPRGGGTLRRVLVPADLAGPRRLTRPHSVHGLHLVEDDDLRLYDPSLDERRVPAAPGGTIVYHHEMY